MDSKWTGIGRRIPIAYAKPNEMQAISPFHKKSLGKGIPRIHSPLRAQSTYTAVIAEASHAPRHSREVKRLAFQCLLKNVEINIFSIY